MACTLQHLGNTAWSHAPGLGSELLQHSQFLTPILYYYFLQFQKTSGNCTGSTQLFQFHCVDVTAPICTATVSKFLYWTQGAALHFAALAHTSLFIMLFTVYLPKGTKLQYGITGHDTLWHQILCSGHSACKQMESIIFTILSCRKIFSENLWRHFHWLEALFQPNPSCFRAVIQNNKGKKNSLFFPHRPTKCLIQISAQVLSLSATVKSLLKKILLQLTRWKNF